MTHINKTALVPYSSEQMYTLVNNVSDYPLFLPWCKTVTIHSSSASEIIATIAMGKMGLDKSFTTINNLVENQRINMTLKEGPFSQLEGYWEFQSLGDLGCKISLHLEFEISNHLLRLSLGPVFTKIITTLMDSFIQRANKVYG